jgi:C1A family cysteine protease
MKKLILLLTAVLIAMPSLSGAADFQPLSSAMEAKIQAIRNEVQAKGGTFEVGYSAAMDKKISQLCRLKIPAGWKKEDAPQVRMLDASVQALPSSYDWRTLNGVTPIKNQGSCGDCWAFSTVGPLESQILLKDGVTVDLSEQYLLSCNVDGWSCNGGWWAHDYHMDKSGQDNNGPGAVLESADPYSGTDAACNKTYNHPYKISSWAYVGSETAVPSVDAIKQAIYTYGPISVGVYVGNAFQAYTGGIFNINESGTVNHAVVLVGWNDDQATDNGYWILRNSWGTSWGESGYMRIRYNISQVGYAANFIEYAGANPAPPPASVTVPNVVDYTQAAATTAITGVGLVVGTVTTQSSSTVASGDVSSQSPAAGATVASGSAVNLVVSSGTAPKPNPNPNPSPTPPAGSKPDLTGVFTSLYTGSSGRTLYGIFRVENIGAAATTSPFRVLLYLSTDGAAKTALLGSATMTAAMPAGSAFNLSINEYTSTSFRGKYAICVVDPDDSNPDSNRSNNVIVKLIQ